MAAHPKTKLKLKIDFDGRQHPFHPDSEETAGALKAEAITFFRFVGDPNTLGLFRADAGLMYELRARGLAEGEPEPHVRRAAERQLGRGKRGAAVCGGRGCDASRELCVICAWEVPTGVVGGFIPAVALGDFEHGAETTIESALEAARSRPE